MSGCVLTLCLLHFEHLWHVLCVFKSPQVKLFAGGSNKYQRYLFIMPLIACKRLQLSLNGSRIILSKPTVLLAQ